MWFTKKRNDFFVKQMSERERANILAVFFKHLSELYASDSLILRVPVKSFELIPMKFYYLVANKIIKKLELNVKLSKRGEDITTVTVPEDRYFELKLK